MHIPCRRHNRPVRAILLEKIARSTVSTVHGHDQSYLTIAKRKGRGRTSIVARVGKLIGRRRRTVIVAVVSPRVTGSLAARNSFRTRTLKTFEISSTFRVRVAVSLTAAVQKKENDGESSCAMSLSFCTNRFDLHSEGEVGTAIVSTVPEDSRIGISAVVLRIKLAEIILLGSPVETIPQKQLVRYLLQIHCIREQQRSHRV